MALQFGVGGMTACTAPSSELYSFSSRLKFGFKVSDIIWFFVTARWVWKKNRWEIWTETSSVKAPVSFFQ